MDFMRDRIKERHAGRVAMHDGDEDQDGRGGNEARDQDLFQPVEDAQEDTQGARAVRSRV